MRRIATLAAATAAACAGGTAQAQTDWFPSGHTWTMADERGREARALRDFESVLDAQPSATKALEQWCARLNAEDTATITASKVTGDDAPLPADARALLGATTATPLAYRHVRLECTRDGQVVTLSEAHNWYMPGLLTAGMNAQLAAGDTPFGKVVAPLGFTRESLSGARGAGCPPGTVLARRALLRLARHGGSDGAPFALLVECYTVGVLAPPLPHLQPVVVSDGPVAPPPPAPR